MIPVILAALVLLLAGCSSTAPVPEGTDLEDTPEWVQNREDKPKLLRALLNIVCI